MRNPFRRREPAPVPDVPAPPEWADLRPTFANAFAIHRGETVTDDSPTVPPGDPDGPADLPGAGYLPDVNESGSAGLHGPSDWGVIADGPVSPATSSSRIMFEERERQQVDHREECSACRGTGYKMTTSDFLRESIGLIEGQEDEVVRLFYVELLNFAPTLVDLFPPDLLDPMSTGEGKGQRDRLVGALSALATTFDLASPDAMNALDVVVAAMGRAHSAFRWPDGSVRRAELEHYYAVKVCLVRTFHAVGGEAWLPVYDAAWSDAFDDTAATMLKESIRNPQQFPRTRRH